MAFNDCTIASNVNKVRNKWVNYYYLPIEMEWTTSLSVPTPGIGQTDGVSDYAGEITGTCTHVLNCDYYYKLRFVDNPSGGAADDDGFWVEKYLKSDNSEVDRIYAAYTQGLGRYWSFNDLGLGKSGVNNMSFTIDIGINLSVTDIDGFSDGQVFTINTPSREDMEKKKFHFGGVMTYMQLPKSEDHSNFSEPIPINLKNRNISFIIGGGARSKETYTTRLPMSALGSYAHASNQAWLSVHFSHSHDTTAPQSPFYSMPITDADCSSTTITITSANHGLLSGDRVSISGTTNFNDDNLVDGVVTRTGHNTFTVVRSSSSSATNETGTWTLKDVTEDKNLKGRAGSQSGGSLYPIIEAGSNIQPRSRGFRFVNVLDTLEGLDFPSSYGMNKIPISEELLLGNTRQINTDLASVSGITRIELAYTTDADTNNESMTLARNQFWPVYLMTSV
tara:strand:+ start:1164 stop:2510 length:1347 start_codon:yes stop_codon:yes gene_type:complete